MEFKDIRTNAEGLKKLIDFIHSDANGRKSPNFNYPAPIFEIRKIGISEEHVRNGEVPMTETPHYLVHIRTYGNMTPERENIKGALDLIRKIQMGYSDNRIDD